MNLQFVSSALLQPLNIVTSMDNNKAQEQTAAGTLTEVAKKIGAAVGTIAAAVGAAPDGSSATGLATDAPKAKAPAPKFEKKNKSRLPRRVKKELQKRAQSSK